MVLMTALDLQRNIDAFTLEAGRSTLLPHVQSVLKSVSHSSDLKVRRAPLSLSAFIIALLAVIVCLTGFAQADEQPLPKLTLISKVDTSTAKP
jgi:hypothetical protein